MRKSKIEFLLIGVAVLALGAGVAGGLLASRLPIGSRGASPTAPSQHHRGPVRTPLTDELGLSAPQREQMRDIWEGVREEVRDTFDKAMELERRRDDALIALLTDEQKARFEKTSQEFATEFATLQQKREELFQQAVGRTKTILTAEQRAKYEEILKTRGPGGPGGPRGPGDRPPPEFDRPMKNDATNPAPPRKNPASGPSQ